MHSKCSSLLSYRLIVAQRTGGYIKGIAQQTNSSILTAALIDIYLVLVYQDVSRFNMNDSNIPLYRDLLKKLIPFNVSRRNFFRYYHLCHERRSEFWQQILIIGSCIYLYILLVSQRNSLLGFTYIHRDTVYKC
jgi:hypothetical protein